MDQYYLVGLDGRQTPDPQYYYDRWQCVKAASHDDAKRKYAQNLQYWLREDERQFVQVWVVSDEEVNPRQWVADHMDVHTQPLKEERPLNKLTSAEYLEDYKVYLKNCDQADQRNPQTYMSELEHQEGSVSPYTKNKFFKLVHEYYMEDATKFLDAFRQDIADIISDGFHRQIDGLEIKKVVGILLEEMTSKLELTVELFKEAMEK